MGVLSRFVTAARRTYETFYGNGKAPETAAVSAVFRAKYNNFQELLESNTELLKIISDIEVLREGERVYGLSAIRSLSSRAVFHTLRMVMSFEKLSGKPRPELRRRVEVLREEIKTILAGRDVPDDGELVLPLSRVAATMVDQVGGKAANLGEIRNKVGLETPDGFAVTTTAFRTFFRESGLFEEIGRIKLGLEPEDPVSVQTASEDIQHAILRAELPAPVAEAVTRAHADLAGAAGVWPGDLRVAVRSSAVGEDGELSFAGQYLSMLGVTADRLLTAYKYVLASLYTPRALAYRLQKGVSDDDAVMAVACLRMAASRAAGVMYTVDPLGAEADRLLINAVWGLGPYAVDGVVDPDAYHVSRQGLAVLAKTAPDKRVMLTMTPEGGLAEAAVPDELRGQPCLSDAAAVELARRGMALEEHFGCPQDVEWAVDPAGRLVILQSRPLRVAGAGACGLPVGPPVPGFELLLEGGQAACAGTGSGPVYVVRREEDLEGFPDGAVLVAAHSSPKFMVVMHRAAAIVTDHGSVTGHMAALAREFGAPSLLGLRGATETLSQGETVTVDVRAGRVYRGRVEALLADRPERRALMTGTQVHGVLGRVAELIVPLNLLNPKSPSFVEASCSTVHDVMRLLHEWSYGEMFKLSDLASSGRDGGMAVRLAASTGLDLRVIDLGGGIVPEAAGRAEVGLDDIASLPFRALLSGLILDPGRNAAPRPVNLGGLMSVIGQQMLTNPTAGGERFGERSYAIISEKYVNFSSRVGYHYGVLDCYRGQTVNKNYITFSFKGGAADDVKRMRRARGIAIILERLGFSVEAASDRVTGRFQKVAGEEIDARLAELGRLLQYTRQVDMLMVNEESVTAMAECFLAGADHFDPNFIRPVA